MKTNWRFLSVAVLFACMGAAVGQGNLNPSGAPAPTMKTLVEVEPRTHINSLPYTITNSGSYYLAGNLSGVSGISVQANNVSLDLAGFALNGLAGSGAGIQVSAGVKNLSVVNGSIQGWTGDGIAAASASACRFEQLRILDNGGAGLRSGASALVTGCTILNNGGDGLVAAAASRLNGNTLGNNGTNTTSAGLRVSGSGSRVEANHVIGGAGKGFAIDSAGNLIVRNSANNTGASPYTIVAGNDYGQIISPGANFTNDVPWANFGSIVCGNGLLEPGETCDDGNTTNGDGCSAACASQSGYVCVGEPSVCNTVCGDGITAGGEQCDDGNINSNDGCSSTCQSEGCVTAQDCPGVDTECQTRFCMGGVCGMNFVAAGTLVMSQTAGDCQRNVCDGSGNIVSTVDNMDIADDGNQCTADFCNNGSPVHQPAAMNSPCSQNGGSVCNSTGNCVECNSASQCPGSDTGCQTRTCNANNCGMFFAAAGTSCSAAACMGNILFPSDTCDGFGLCVDQGSVNCSPYLCSGGSCSTFCSSDANCVSTHYCSGGACVAKKASGQSCNGNNECQSNVCNGNVCQ